MKRCIATCAIFFLLWGCGPTQPALTNEQAATATAVSAFATFEALPPAFRQATQTAVAKKILEGLDATPTP